MLPGGFRRLYAEGAAAHYAKSGADYRNPHESAICIALGEALGDWGVGKGKRGTPSQSPTPRSPPIPEARGSPGDRLSTGSLGPGRPFPCGLQTRLACAPPSTPRFGPDDAILDLAAGSGEVSLALANAGFRNVSGCDPFTARAYERRVGRPAASWSFQDVANGCIPETTHYSLVVCSFALHLVEPSWMPALLGELARASDYLLVVSPHKKPAIPPDSPWVLESPGELRIQRLRIRLFRSRLSITETGTGTRRNGGSASGAQHAETPTAARLTPALAPAPALEIGIAGIGIGSARPVSLPPPL